MSTPGDVTKRPLPAGWRWVKLGEVCKLIGESISPQSFPKETFAHYSIPAFDAGAGPTIELGEVILSNKILFAKGAVLFSKLNPRIARVWHVQDNTSYRRICSTEFLPLFPDPEYLNAEFLTFCLQEPSSIEALRARVSAATKSRERLKPEIVLNMSLPLPPLSEQQRIAAILREQMAAVERARRAAEEQLEAAKALPAAFLRQVFPRTGEPLPAGWRWVKLGEVCEERTGVRDPRQQPSSQFRYVDITSVDNKTKRIIEPKTLFGKDAPSRARQVIRTGDVLVATTRPNLNAVALVPPELDNEICSTGFCVLRAKTGLSPDFLFAWVQTPDFVEGLVELVKGALYPAVTDNQVRAQVIPLPPLSEQKRIAAILREQMAAVERARRAAEEQLEAIHKLPAAILRKAFEGRL